MKKADDILEGGSPQGKKPRKSTIYDVAKLAGVSAGTVSHVINKTATISDETKARVVNAIRELDYTRNENARALRTSSSRIIGLVLRDISSEYYARCTAGILQRAQVEGYAVLTLDGNFSPSVLKTGVQALVNRGVDGLIFVGGSHDSDSYELADEAGVSIVFADRYVPDYPCVQFNNYETMNRLVRALYRQGYREFCYYGEALTSQQNLEERFGGFQDAVRDLEIPRERCEVILQNDLDSEKMRKAFEYFSQWFKSSSKHPNARVIMTSNDMIAQGVIAAALRSGIRVPEELAVFGFDDISISAYVTPSISTVMQDPYLLGEKCFELLQQQMRSKKRPIENIMLEQKIVLRESVTLDEANALAEGLAVAT